MEKIFFKISNKKNGGPASTSQGGYTIIETMIAVSLFIVISVVGMGALLNANLLHQKSQNMRSIMDNLSFIMEDMSKNMRTGYNYQCFRNIGDPTLHGASADTLSQANLGVPRSCSNGWAVAFEAAGGDNTKYTDQWVYYLDSTGKIFKSTQGADPANFVQLTPDEVVIDPLSSFVVIGAEPVPGDNQQPIITIKLVGKIIYQKITTPFSLQTTVSQRLIDI